MDGYNNTVFLTDESLQVLPWNNDTIIDKMDAWKWKRCRYKSDCFQYMQSSYQGGIVISISNISLLQFLFCKNTVSLKEWVAAITFM